MIHFNYKRTLRSLAFSIMLSSTFAAVQAQDNLVNSLIGNQGTNSKAGYTFKDVINLANTSVKDQGSSGTCWSYATNSFLESEMIRAGKKAVDLSEIFTARCAYIEKGRNYVRMHGAVTLGEGGSAHDVINMYRKYGALPQEVYTGLNYGTNKNNFGEMSGIMESVLQAVVKNPNKQLTTNWMEAYTAVIDTYLGKVPEKFTYEGKSYTPQTFAKEVVGLNADDYVELGSVTDHPYYSKFTLLIPDNWSFDQVYNVQINELTSTIDNALKNGHTVAWATDVSENSFSWQNGVAYVPVIPFEEMNEDQKQNLFNGPQPEMTITPEVRQLAFDNYSTTDDHGMHIVGLSKDQNGREYYIVKNSWGISNDYKGYLYVTKEYVKYKTTSILLNKKGIANDLRKKLSI
jgi:bleomycin hydrolase